MDGEIISIETAQKIARLEKENLKLSNNLINYSNEYEQLFNKLEDFRKYIKARKSQLATNNNDSLKDTYSNGKMVGGIKELDLMLKYFEEVK